MAVHQVLFDFLIYKTFKFGYEILSYRVIRNVIIMLSIFELSAGTSEEKRLNVKPTIDL